MWGRWLFFSCELSEILCNFSASRIALHTCANTKEQRSSWDPRVPRGQGAWEHGDLGAWGLGAWGPNSLDLGGNVTFLFVQLGTSYYV